jgi:hypothetical protein
MTYPDRALKAIEGKEPPADAYGAGYLQHQARTTFRDLARLVGLDEARQVIAEIINDEYERRPRGHEQ